MVIRKNNIIYSLFLVFLLGNAINMQGQSNNRDSLVISFLNELKDKIERLEKQLENSKTNVTAPETQLDTDSIAALNTQIEQLIIEKERADSIIQSMNVRFEPLTEKAKASEDLYFGIKSITLFEDLNAETINKAINDLELMKELFPEPKYTSYLQELNELKLHIACIDSAQKILDQPFDNGRIIEAQHNLSQINNTSIAYNKAKDFRTLLSQYKPKLGLFDNILSSIQYIDGTYKDLNNSTMNKKHLEEIQEYVKREKANIEAIPFLKRKMEELLQIKEKDVHQDVSNILKQE